MINYKENKRILNDLCHEIKVLWEERESRMCTELIKNIDTKQDSKDFWREINKMGGKKDRTREKEMEGR